MFQLNPLHCLDFYKIGHIDQYPKGTTEIYSNMTARGAYNDNKIIFFGLQYFIKSFLIDSFNQQFFNKSIHDVIDIFSRRISSALGSCRTDHIMDLHILGYLPLKIKALPEGDKIPLGIPFITIVNTHPDFFWLTNFIETALSCYLWKPITSATTAYNYKSLMTKYSTETCDNHEHIDFQCHDFSCRGMSGMHDAALSGAAHLLNFKGTDTVCALDLVEQYYNQCSSGFSVPATEHSVMCIGSEEREIETFDRLISTVYPNGIVSIVSDSWDYWNVIKNYLPKLKDKIMSRDGKVVIRPDSGDPVKIICGDEESLIPEEKKGSIELLWELFGGSINSKGYKVLDPHIGLIYGDAITLERAQKILQLLKDKGFASSNIVFGVGSYTYQYVTRDNYGLAIKATSGIINGKRKDIFKNPKTGNKKSAKGLLRVEKESYSYVLYEQQSEQEEAAGELTTIFQDGKLLKEVNFDDIRTKMAAK